MGNLIHIVTIYTDGSCIGNPGPGGWAAILMSKGRKKEICGGNVYTTNNQMELEAVVSALSCLLKPCKVTIYTDSQYVCNSVNLGWLDNWKHNGWRNSSGKLKNLELWIKLDKFRNIHDINFIWVKGHSDNPFNNRCDQIAKAEAYKRCNK